MPQASARVNEDLDDAIETFSDEHDVSRSEAIRQLLQRGVEYDELERKRDALQNQLNTLVGAREEHQELVRYVEEERAVRRRREEAGLLTRSKWWLFGRSGDDEQEGGRDR